MEASSFDEEALFRAPAAVRCLLIGRRGRQPVVYSADLSIALPAIDDLNPTKRFGARRKDVLDIELLEALGASKP